MLHIITINSKKDGAFHRYTFKRNADEAGSWGIFSTNAGLFQVISFAGVAARLDSCKPRTPGLGSRRCKDPFFRLLVVFGSFSSGNIGDQIAALSPGSSNHNWPHWHLSVSLLDVSLI